MARPTRDSAIDLGKPHDLTAGLIERLQCPAGKGQALLRDVDAPSLRVRVTRAGAKSFVFEAKLNRATIRRTIGDVREWTIKAARAEANRLRVEVDKGNDPREQERERTAADAARKAADAAQAATVSEAWGAYIEARRERWSEHHYRDHVRKAQAGGVPAVRGTRGRGKTVAGPLHPLMALRLRELTPAVMEAWAKREGRDRPTAARLAWRLFRGFLTWCAEHPVYAPALAAGNPAKGRAVREALGKGKAKQDALQREQLPAWFAAVRQLRNPTAAAYLQVLLLTGARPGEILSMRWEDVNTQWRGLTIRDKVEGQRVVPLTPYVAHLLSALPRVNAWVFASPLREQAGAGMPMSKPHKAHAAACQVAGIEGLTLHGLRRSFKSLTEWQEMPAGVVAQLMGHKPSATAERHYTVRPLDLLRLHHERIEAWILGEAGITFKADAPAGLRRVF